MTPPRDRPAPSAAPPPRVERGTKSATTDPRGPTYCERHRHECEVRHVARLEAEAREAFLKAVRARRGDEAANRLMDDVVRLLNARVRRRAEAARIAPALPGL